LLLAATSSAAAAEKFRSGTLSVRPKASFELMDSSGNPVAFKSGDVEISVKKKGIGDGGLVFSTNTGTVTVKIPRKSYDKGTDFMLYAKTSGQKYNIRGSEERVTLSTGQPKRTTQTCLYNGVVVSQTLVCGKVTKTFGPNEVVLNLCSGKKLVEVVSVTSQDVYSLKFFDPQGGTDPVATASLKQDPVTSDEVVEEITDCS
jgi:hypothetical protein